MRRITLQIGLFSALAIASALAASCGDPVHSSDVSALGSDTTTKNEFHRAGQPCVVCHGEQGPANEQFSVAGTIFSQPGDMIGVDQAQVELTDAAGTKYTATTNCVGNFFVTPAQWAPHFPILVRIAKGGVSRTMATPIGREPSCGKCHDFHLPNSQPFYLMDHVYLFGTDEASLPACAVNPVLQAAQ